MTTGRAIELLRCRDGVNFTLDEYCAAIDMAIEALGKYPMSEEAREANAVFKDAIEVFGEDAQILMVFEEMAELQKELCKWLRGNTDAAERYRIAEEIADVEIMLAQMKLLFDNRGLVLNYRREKTARLAGRIEKIKKNRTDEAEGKNESHRRTQETNGCPADKTLTKSVLGRGFCRETGIALCNFSERN